jgi:hypothetical protein
MSETRPLLLPDKTMIYDAMLRKFIAGSAFLQMLDDEERDEVAREMLNIGLMVMNEIASGQRRVA